jgi:hypothetical protein
MAGLDNRFGQQVRVMLTIDQHVSMTKSEINDVGQEFPGVFSPWDELAHAK